MENQSIGSKKCPYCDANLELKKALLYCPKQKIFIGKPEDFESKHSNLGSLEKEGGATIDDTKSKRRRFIRSFPKFRTIFKFILIIGIGLFVYQIYLVPWLLSKQTTSIAEKGLGVPELFPDTSWDTAGESGYGKFTLLKESGFLPLIRPFFRSSIVPNLGGTLWGTSITNIETIEKTRTLSNSFYNYYDEKLGKAGWTDTVIFNGGKYKVVDIVEPDNRLFKAYVAVDADNNFRAILLLEDIYTTTPGTCPCGVLLEVFVSDIEPIDDALGFYLNFNNDF